MSFTKEQSNGSSSRKRKSLSNTKTVYDERFEVESIVSHMVINGKVSKYLVKWRGYGNDTNTWEPVDHLSDCLESIAKYFHNLIYPGKDKKHYLSKTTALKKVLSECSSITMENLARVYFTDDGDNIPYVDEKELNETLTLLAQIPPIGHSRKIINEIKLTLTYRELKLKRDEQLKALKQWEEDINMVCCDQAPIKVVNSVDLEGPPANFFYVNSYVEGPGIIIPKDPPVGCGCFECPKKNCCAHQCARIPYADGLLKVPRGTPIYECNSQCNCGASCSNRVVQHGRTIPVAIFRTGNGCGWGLRTLVEIRKGQFVVEYVGEVITTEEAERRGRSYDKEGCTYLFDLDFNDRENFPYTVDAAVYGNVSHFINHSCHPNLEVYAVWVECLDPDIPKLGLFATRTIKANEELSFDYLCQPTKNIKKNGNMKNDGNLCKCEAKNCRKYLFFN